jgi:ketosteroid isomerase-like protein
MKSTLVALAFTVLVPATAASVVAHAAPPGQTNGGAEAGLIAADKAWSMVYSAKNLSKSVAACDDQVSFLFPNAPIVVGKAAIAKAIQDDFSKGDLTWRPKAAGVARSGDLGYTSGLYEAKLKTTAGGTVVDNGKYLTVWKKERDGAWKVLFDTFNTDRP